MSLVTWTTRKLSVFVGGMVVDWVSKKKKEVDVCSEGANGEGSM